MEEAAAWQAEIAADQRPKVIVDDDPTGTQTVSDVDVILGPERAAFDDFFASEQRATFVLSNSRALPVRAATELVGDIAAMVRAAAQDAGRSSTLILRGDSTLRGHVFAEVEAVAPDTPVLFVPAFLDGGRFTRDGIHHLRTPAGPVPVSETEFARDPVFGYRSGTLPAWVREASGGRRYGTTIPLARLRRHGPDTVAESLLDAEPNAVVIPDCVSHGDVLAIAAGLLRAQRQGASVMVRCAASLAAALAGLSTRRLDRIELPSPGRVLIACGSFTSASTRQLRALGELWRRRVEIPASPYRGDDRSLACAVRERLAQDGHALLATDRSPSHATVPAAPQLLMDSLVATVRRLAADVDLVIAKGGTTSARLATDALRANGARVRGQILPGVPVWNLRTPRGDASYVVVPGNIGADSTLADILDRVHAPSVPASSSASPSMSSPGAASADRSPSVPRWRRPDPRGE